MGKTYRTEDGRLAFVFCPAEGEARYYTVTQGSRNRSVIRLWDKKLLPKRYTEKEAERDLERYARMKGWEVVYVNGGGAAWKINS